MQYLICYDICDAKRLRKTAEILEDYGMRVQKSFFQVEMPKERLEGLVRRILRIINTRYDKLYIYPICEGCLSKALKDGTGTLIKLQEFEIL